MTKCRVLAWAAAVMLAAILIPTRIPAAQNRDGQAEELIPITSSLFQHLNWRNIGPANMMGRVSDIEGVPGNPNIVYVGSASGGVWKTSNGGVTWIPIFDDQPVASIGDIALEPGNPNVVYVGTGEANVRNSISFGKGVYKSTDGGKTWTLLGLEDTERISRIVINPSNPRIVFVGALGRAYGSNRERGVFRSPDGGVSWEKVLYTDDQHGVSDMDINPQNPNIVYAGLWRFERKPWTFTSGDALGGLYRSVDGGRNWTKLTQGLPVLVGRIAVKVAPSRPDVVYVMTESQEGTLYRSDNGGESFRRVSRDVEIVSRGFYYTDLRVDPTDENRVYAVSSRLQVSIDGGEKFRRISASTHVDYHSLWIDPRNPRRMWQGQDGGICVSYDRGRSWDYVNTFAIGQFYQIYADNREPFYYVGGGMQDNGTWYGPSRSREPAGILNDDWRMISFGDGFHIVVHPENHELFLSESQGGGISRTNMLTRQQQDVSPQSRRADGAPVSELPYRFNWNTPIIRSPHDGDIVFVGGNVVFKSEDFGSTWEVISPDLTTNDPDKQKEAGGPAWPENTTAEYHCTIISLAESPVQPGVLWAGTDDGRLHVSMNGGAEWSDVDGRVPDLPPNSPVSHVEPSITSAGLAYCSFDRHMLDDFRPYIFRTPDFGLTWTEITGDLPDEAYVWVVREDPKNPRILYAGTELGLFVTFNRGEEWIRLHLNNLPAVAVHDILVHPRDNDLILGTHGRSIWILDDISFLQEIDPEFLNQEAYIFATDPALRFGTKFTRYGIGDRVFLGTNPPYGAQITYYLKTAPSPEAPVSLEIMDEARQIIRRLTDIPRTQGLNRMSWDLQLDGPRPRKKQVSPPEQDIFFRGPTGPQVLPGNYTVRLNVGESSFEKPLHVILDPTLESTQEDLRTQQAYAFELRDMQSLVNDALRALDTIQAQLQERKRTLDNQVLDAPEEVSAAIEEHLGLISGMMEEMVKPEGRPFWSEGPRLIGRLSSLFRAVEGANARPTAVQASYLDELRQEFGDALSGVNSYLGRTAPELNTLFERFQLPRVLIPDLIDY
jgi:photosystem II stability/assembly factor-like uncharacterized protein